MKSLPQPTLPWQLVSQDRFSLHGKNYLVTVCHHSDWIETDELENTLSSTVVNATRRHFVRFGVPEVCHTNNGPQIISKEYQDFARDYGFKDTTSSPYHSQGNGRAEAAVKVCKSQLRKSEDYDKAMLFYRNTPPTGHTYSAAQRMFCHRTRTTLPTCDSLLAAQSVDSDIVLKELQHKRTLSNNSYDETTGPEHMPLHVGTHVYAKPPPHHRGDQWTYGKVVRSAGSRSYTIQTRTGIELRRNSVHLRPAAAPTVPDAPRYDIPMPTVGMIPTYSSADGTTADTSDVTQPAEEMTPTSPCPEVGVDEGHHKHERAYRTRAGRAVKPRDILDL
jgi:hypothetical protein